MQLFKVKSKKTYLDSEGKEKHYINYFLEVSDGKYIAIQPKFKEDYKMLSFFATYKKED